MSTFAIGDEVALPQGHRAILRWIGRIPGRQPIEYAGVEVIGPQASLLGKHSGTYEGRRYFETGQPGTGLFVSYTQLVSANVRTPRLAPPSSSPRIGEDSLGPLSPRSPRSPRAQSPLHQFTREFNRELATSSPRFHKPPLTDASPTGSGGQRDFFRNALRATNEKVAELQATFEAKIAEITASYEQKLNRARRSSTLASPGSSEVEEQRQALASMQNKLINERAEKQEEIDSLKRELQHMRRLAGSAEDLEQLVGDLGRYEQQLAELRSQVIEMDTLKEEMGKLRSQNAVLELGTRAGNSGNENPSSDVPKADSALEAALAEATQAKADLQAELELSRAELSAVRAEAKANASTLDNNTAEALRAEAASLRAELMQAKQAADSSRAEVARLEKALESKLVRESELEAINEQLQAELSRSSQPRTPSAESAGLVAESARPTTKGVPVPSKLAAFDESSMIDLAAGRSDWCSLCEREGHTAVDCPYE